MAIGGDSDQTAVAVAVAAVAVVDGTVGAFCDSVLLLAGFSGLATSNGIANVYYNYTVGLGLEVRNKVPRGWYHTLK